MQCERCGTIAASLIFMDGTERCDFKDYARLMYPKYSRGTAPVWIIGPPVRSGPEPECAADILKLDFNSTNTSPCRDMTYVVFPDRRKSLATKNLRRLVPRIGRNSLLGNRLR